MKKNYGKELILDIHNCNRPFTRKYIKTFLIGLCDDILKMERADLHFWGYRNEEEKMKAPEHLAGTSAVQFITTSNVTIHTLDKLKVVYLNIFTCAELDQEEVSLFCIGYWGGNIVNNTLIERI